MQLAADFVEELRIINAEPMRIGGQPGHEVRAQAKDPQTGADIEIVQWLRFGTGAYLRILGFGPKDKWTDTFTRFRAVRDRVRVQETGAARRADGSLGERPDADEDVRALRRLAADLLVRIGRERAERIRRRSPRPADASPRASI